MAKPIYQLYDEWLVRHQRCKLCTFSTMGPVQNRPDESYKAPTNSDGVTMEDHIRKEHPKAVEV